MKNLTFNGEEFTISTATSASTWKAAYIEGKANASVWRAVAVMPHHTVWIALNNKLDRNEKRKA